MGGKFHLNLAIIIVYIWSSSLLLERGHLGTTILK